jgi:cobalamin biosynthesis protein CbiD
MLRLAGEHAVNRKAAKEMNKTVEDALATAETAGYRIDVLQGPPAASEAIAAQDPATETQAPERKKSQTAL